MIIHPAQIEQQGEEVVLSARVEFTGSRRGDSLMLDRPPRAYYRFPAKYAPLLSGRADAFAAALFPLAMALGEEMIVQGVCSPRLAYGLEKIQEILLWWYPGQVQHAAFTFEQLSPLPQAQAGNHTVALFSGGVDSSYTLLEHLPGRRAPSLQAAHALFIHGLDIPLQNRISYTESLAAFDKALRPLGVELISCATNLRYFYTGILKWEIAHGGITISTGLALDGLVKHLLVAASHTMSTLIPWGSSPISDHWLSTETIDVIHHGVTVDRLDKLRAVSDWPPAQSSLRICVNEDKRRGVQNCGTCDKCLRTRVMLEVTGSGGQVATLPADLKARHILKWVPSTPWVWIPQIIRCCRAQGKRRYIPLLWFAWARGSLHILLRKLLPKPLFRWLKKRWYPPEKDPFNPRFLDEDLS